MKKWPVVIGMVLLAGVFSCNRLFDDIENAEVDLSTEIGLHVADLSFYIDSTLNIEIDSLFDGMSAPVIELAPGEDGVLRLHIQQNLPPFRLDSFLTLEGTVFTDTIGFPALNGFFIEGKTLFGFQLSTFDSQFLTGKTIDSIRLDRGRLNLQFNTYEQFNSKFSIRFPGIVDANNAELQVLDFIPSAKHKELEFDLSNHTIKLTKRNEKEYFTIDLDYFIEGLEEDSPQEPEIRVILSDMDLDYAYGSLGYDTIPGIRDLEVPMPGPQFENQEVSIDFENPQISFNTLNSFALPFRYDINSFLMRLPDGRFEEVTGIPDSIYIGAPDASAPDEYISSSFALDPSTNFDILMSEGPDLLLIEGELWTNPYEPEHKNYLTDKDSLSVQLDLDIPFSMRVSEIVLEDSTWKVDFRQLDNSSYRIEKLKMKIDIENGFPMDLHLQSYFYDDAGAVIDSLFSRAVDITGPGDEGGFTVATFYMYKDREALERLFNTKKTRTIARFKTSEADEEKIVSFLEEQALNIKLTFFAKLSI
ncbi:MAG: hypothetical protein CSA96_03425 [Bacteroidetes bacterium]|nr:MAG: hypothetical protein CSA96_03425 [Bacteroidota bacterium]